MLSDKVILDRDPIWFERPSVLLASHRLFEFWPHPMHTRAEKVNAIARFALYTSLALYLARRDPKFLVMGVIAVLTVTLAYRRMPDPPAALPMAKDLNIRKPTPHNPMGNPLAGTDAYADGKLNPPAETADGKMEAVRDEMLKKGIFMNFDDAWSNYSMERQFYTVPEQDTIAFANYLYGGMDKSLETRAKKTSHFG